MKWIKASERLGEFKGGFIPKSKVFKPDFCKLNGKQASDPCFTKDVEDGTIIFSYYHLRSFRRELTEDQFYRIEWLDESEPASQPSAPTEAAVIYWQERCVLAEQLIIYYSDPKKASSLKTAWGKYYEFMCKPAPEPEAASGVDVLVYYRIYACG